jgi:uncharacterized protein
MPLSERITDVDKMRFFKDKLPLRYEYTAGLAGEKFLRGLQDGRILASRCAKCGKRFLPPRSYCVECFVPITRFGDAGPEGTISALTESYVAFDGSRIKTPVTMAFVTFRGTTGGLVHRVSGRHPEIGAKVSPRFKPKSKRKGSLLDIEEFRVVRG